ncbi:iron (metal) dependent repressor, DtxR family [Sulfurivirga caldicuralii]|uniref:Transcriptional regulator MntR n=1 Tax=Sulfurivirga caldicuralii TaxID=364032 RepID=A0A1N6GWB4_9GAMM|nr:metal-dependent transcriptional regulator [Sulfurivirga caldicuralii]SIO11752.1 iron (metal) dependent repressor, DtxR family [Sulfurivirga caldicuralii]
MPDMHSRSVQDYLKALYKLQHNDTPVSTSELAARLHVAPASATAMIKKLADAGLVEHVPYQGSRLTESGRREAVNMVRRHRIIEQFLQEVLHYRWDEVDEEAEVLEHAVSDKMVDRMWEVLGRPSHDPHGSPIPDADGHVPHQPGTPLSEWPDNTPATIVRLVERSPEELRYFAQQGIRPGEAVQIVQRAPFDGPITIRTASGETSLSPELAQAIHVQ